MIGFWSGDSGGGGGSSPVLLSTYELLIISQYPASKSSPFVTATPQGLSPPYTVLWEYVSGDSSLFPNNRNSLSTKFTCTPSSPGDVTAIWRCKVTDSVGTIGTSDNITIDALISEAGGGITP